MLETKKCAKCCEEKPVNKFGKSWGCNKTKSVCKACYAARDRAKLKLDTLNAFGRRCECCGETHPMFLTLEHRIQNESSSATGLKSHQLYRIARQEGWPREKYQCLCFNCNCAKGHFGQCPHKTGVTPVDWYQMQENAASGTGRQFVNQNMSGLALGPEARRNHVMSPEKQKQLLQMVTALETLMKKPAS